MQKKILFPVITLLLLLFLLPIFGNSTITLLINDRLDALEAKGISYKILKDESGYFKSKKSYSFTITDKEKFFNFILNQAHQQVPPYLDMLQEGIQIGIDAEYANIPVVDVVSLDIYPMKLADKQMESLKDESEKSYKKLQRFLAEKELLYHIEYDLVDMKFSGYIKDIDDGIMFQKSNTIDFSLKDVKFNGSGLLIQPDSYVSDIKKFEVTLSSFSKEIMSLKVKDLYSSGNFKSKLEFDTLLQVKNLLLKVRQDRLYHSTIQVNDLDMQVVSLLEGKKIDVTLDTLFDKLEFQAENEVVDLNNTKIHFKATQVDKDAFLEAQKAFDIYQKQESKQTEQLSIQKNIELLSKGLKLNLEKFVIKNVAFNNNNLGSFSSKLAVDVKEDDKLFEKLETKSGALKNITMQANVSLSKDLFNLFKMYSPSFVLLENIAIEKQDKYLFDIKLQDAKTQVNGKAI